MTDLKQLVDGWKANFWSADHSIEWLEAEREVVYELDEITILMGRLDAIGRTNEGVFFGEWKTANPREKKTWKQTWRLNPQSLTYGVLAKTLYPECRRFTVRKAFKEIGAPSYDHAWYTYSDEELTMWMTELMRIAREIREYRERKWPENWPVNFKACFQYGVNYACPFFEPACSKGDWLGLPKEWRFRESHLDAERRLNTVVPGRVVLDATRVATWLECREKYRRQYEHNVAVPPGPALQLGIDFHEEMGNYYKGLIRG